MQSLRWFSLRLDVLRKRAAISLRCQNEAFNISERYCSRSHYFRFWTACCQGIKDSLSKFKCECCASRCIIPYAFIDILVASLWERSIYHFWAAQPPVFKEVFIVLSRPDSSNSRVDFSTDGSSRPDRIVTILQDICLLSYAYFLFKLKGPTSCELGRQQQLQLTTRLSSCLLDMCAAWLSLCVN